MTLGIRKTGFNRLALEFPDLILEIRNKDTESLPAATNKRTIVSKVIVLQEDFSKLHCTEIIDNATEEIEEYWYDWHRANGEVIMKFHGHFIRRERRKRSRGSIRSIFTIGPTRWIKRPPPEKSTSGTAPCMMCCSSSNMRCTPNSTCKALPPGGAFFISCPHNPVQQKTEPRSRLRKKGVHIDNPISPMLK